MRFYELRNPADITRLTERLGFLPFFANGISGFSVEENCPIELWFSDTADGPWEWKGDVIKSGKCLYGKFFKGKMGFISKEWFPRFANYRRDGYDFDALCDEGLAGYYEKQVYDAINERGKLVSKELKSALGCFGGKGKWFDKTIGNLQHKTYACISDFVYPVSKNNEVYGWGIAEYSTPEYLFGKDFVSSAYSEEPRESFEKIVDHLLTVLGEREEDIVKIIK